MWKIADFRLLYPAAPARQDPGAPLMNPISDTAFYCCGIRMEDAKRTHSLCNDIYAERFMNKRGRSIFEPFKSEKMPNISNITRCRIIDDHLRDELSKHDNLTIVTIGSGFDTRPYRLSGGSWVEIIGRIYQ
jgi:O-methyltransferase involved in polyketide biosynthesis